MLIFIAVISSESSRADLRALDTGPCTSISSSGLPGPKPVGKNAFGYSLWIHVFNILVVLLSGGRLTQLGLEDWGEELVSQELLAAVLIGLKWLLATSRPSLPWRLQSCCVPRGSGCGRMGTERHPRARFTLRRHWLAFHSSKVLPAAVPA